MGIDLICMARWYGGCDLGVSILLDLKRATSKTYIIGEYSSCTIDIRSPYHWEEHEGSERL